MKNSRGLALSIAALAGLVATAITALLLTGAPSDFGDWPRPPAPHDVDPDIEDRFVGELGDRRRNGGRDRADAAGAPAASATAGAVDGIAAASAVLREGAAGQTAGGTGGDGQTLALLRPVRDLPRSRAVPPSGGEPGEPPRQEPAPPAPDTPEPGRPDPAPAPTTPGPGRPGSGEPSDEPGLPVPRPPSHGPDSPGPPDKPEKPEKPGPPEEPAPQPEEPAGPKPEEPELPAPEDPEDPPPPPPPPAVLPEAPGADCPGQD